MFTPVGASTSKSHGHKKAIADITQWVTEDLQRVDTMFSADKYQIMVTEIQCNEPDCVPIETLVIVILMLDTVSTAVGVGIIGAGAVTSHANKQKWADKILKPVKEVTQFDVQELISKMFDVSARKEFENKLTSLIDEYVENGDDQLVTSVAESLETAAAALRERVALTKEPPIALTTVSAAVPLITRVVMTPTVNTPAVASAGSEVTGAGPIRTDKQTNSTQETIASTNIPHNPAPAILPTEHNMQPVSISTTPATTAAVPPAASVPAAAPKVTMITGEVLTGTMAPRHKKGGTRPRGCPCCDPDNLDNIVDALMFSHYPQT